jgi:cytochrome c551/c552
VGKKIPAFIISSIILIQGALFMRTYAQAPNGAELFKVCGACHTIGKGKLVGPDLKGVNDRHPQDWMNNFIRNSQAMVQAGDPAAVKLFEENNKIPMPPNNLTDEQILAILDYIKNYDPAQAEAQAVAAAPAATPPTEVKPYVFMEETHHPWANFQLTVIASIILITLSLIDFFGTKFVKARFVHIIIILISVAIIAEVTYEESKGLGRQQFYEPDQPIAFSHYIHAGQNKIDCKYCHSTVTESKYAGFPSPQLCMNCHFVVRKGANSGTAEIEKIYKALETGKSIEWVKVHNVPDHVYFNHAQHVAAGKVDCMDCHGDVAKMDRIMQVNNLGMGWCIECHRTREVQFIDNTFYARYTKLHDELKLGSKKMVTVDDIGGTNCSKCHY